MFRCPSGNRIRKLTYRNNELTAVISEYNAKNQLVKTTEGENVTQFTYSYRGSLVTEGNTNRSYDCRDKQLSYRDADNVTTTYTYYIDGLRKSKKVGTGETKYFIWSNGNMVYEFTATDDNTYFFGLHLISSDDYKYVLNAHGDVVALVNSSGTVTKRYEYDAFGVELNPDENDTNPYRYCAEYFDVESGTIYLRARYYSPNHGRFTQLDPARDGLNWYAYCSNNPILFVDPWGLSEELGSYYNIENDPNAAIKVEVEGNTVIVTAYVYITGAAADKDCGGSTYRELVVQGIRNKWSGQYTVNGQDVTVEVRIADLNDGNLHIIAEGQKSIPIEIVDEAGISNVSRNGDWGKDNNGKMTIYTYFADGEIRTADDFMNTAAHEFGHLVGVGDAYNVTNDSSEFDMMRWRNYGHVPIVTTYDVQKMVKAYATNKRQPFGSEGAYK